MGVVQHSLGDDWLELLQEDLLAVPAAAPCLQYHLVDLLTTSVAKTRGTRAETQTVDLALLPTCHLTQPEPGGPAQCQQEPNPPTHSTGTTSPFQSESTTMTPRNSPVNAMRFTVYKTLLSPVN